MARELKTGDQIRAEIQRMIDAAQGAEMCNVLCCAPVPELLPQPDASGCNWTVALIPSCHAPCRPLVEEFISRVMEAYNLK